MNAFYSKKVVIKPICKANTDLMFLLGSRYIEKFYNEFHCCNMIELEMVLSKIAKDMTGYVVYSRKTDELLGTMIFVHNKLESQRGRARLVGGLRKGTGRAGVGSSV